MHLIRLFVAHDLRPGLQLTLDAEQAHYIGKVLRLRIGDTLTVFNGQGGEFAATAESIQKKAAVLLIGEQSDVATESPLRIHLVQGISRGDRMDFVVQKATELGVKRITPVLTEYGVIRLDADRAARRRDHWQGVAASACEQSGRTRPPLVDDPTRLNAWFGARTKEADTDLILQPGATTALTALAAPVTKVCLLIGPEGGFSDSEYEDAKVAGFKAVSLGPRILRTETAAVAALAVAQSLWGDLRQAARRPIKPTCR
jgi:16S rRNA (uracil1498-N3)-methyltransferase